jgi:hypothetical protein
MNKKCAFTIVAKNYIGLGRILGTSLQRLHNDVDFRIFVADTFDDQTPSLPQDVVIVKHLQLYSEAEWTDMAFKYDLTEFCTAVKPACFERLFSEGYDQVLYFDPDIYIFSPLDGVFSKLCDYDVALTPQIAGIHVDYQGEHPEWAMNVNGIFNLGFCAMRNSERTTQIVQWWKQRLKDNSFMDRSMGNFTDQKWMDWMPGFLGSEHLYVFHDLGMNMAPWNFFERELFDEDGRIMVRYRTDDCPQRHDPLVFIHFAGYDYQQMKLGVISRKRIENLQEYTDLQMATDIYKEAIMENQAVFDSFIRQPYSYATYDNGLPIAKFHRRLYHGLTLEGQHFDNPFSAAAHTYYHLLKKKGMIVREKMDNLNQRNIGGLDKKKRMIALLFGTLYRLMGYKRYALFLKSLYHYCRPELHTFLIK